MMRGQASRRVLTERLHWVDRMVGSIRKLPLNDRDAFFADERNIGMLESCLRRALEALLDAGRHLLAKQFTVGVAEYKQIASELQRFGVLNQDEAAVLRVLAGYCNRLVHFYHEIGEEELHQVAVQNLDDVLRIAAAIRRWIESHPEAIQDDL